MFSRMGIRVTAAAVVLALLGGCAEIDRRGGVADQIEDVVFKADTKSHRLLRSYLLVGILLAAAERQGVNNVDRDNIKGSLASALKVSNEAFNCLYPGTFTTGENGLGRDSGSQVPEIVLDYSKPTTISAESYTLPRWCQFFDEKMARLDLAIFRLASITLFNDRSRGQLADVRDRLVGRIPVISDSVRAAISANKVVNQASTIIDDLLNLTLASFGPATVLFPLYRDSLELNTWIIIDTLAINCARQRTSGIASGEIDFCTTYESAYAIAGGGNAAPVNLRAFIKSVDGLSLYVEAYRPHFYVVSRLIWQSCENVFVEEASCKTILAYALETTAFNVKNATDPQTGRRFLASLFSFQRVASTRKKPTSPTPATSEPQTTGSIPRPSGTQGMAPAR